MDDAEMPNDDANLPIYQLSFDKDENESATIVADSCP